MVVVLVYFEHEDEPSMQLLVVQNERVCHDELLQFFLTGSQDRVLQGLVVL